MGTVSFSYSNPTNLHGYLTLIKPKSMYNNIILSTSSSIHPDMYIHTTLEYIPQS